MAATTGVTGSSSGSRVLPASSLLQLANQCPAWRDKHIGPLMAAIALAESGGDPNSENYCCVGLWQINVLVHTQYTRAQMKDPIQNLRAACAIYASQGLQAWESYTNGSYKKYTGQVEKGAKEAEGTFSGSTTGAGILGFGIGPNTEKPGHELSEEFKKRIESSLSWTQDLAKVLSFLSSSQGWTRIGKVILGATLMVIAVDQLTKIGPGPTTHLKDAAMKGL